MSETYLVTVNATAAARAAALVPIYQAKDPAADLDYVYRAASRLGSRKLGIRPAHGAGQYKYTGADFALNSGGAAEVSVEVDDEDAARIEAVAALLSVAAVRVAGAAVCTGLALLSGIGDRIVGPFTL